MAQIVFKNKKKGDDKPKEQVAPNSVLGVLANFFHWFIVLVCLAVLISGYIWLLKPKYDLIVNDEYFKKEEKLYGDKVTYLRQLRSAKNAYDNISDEEKKKIDTLLSVGQDIETLKISLLQDLTYLGKIYSAKIEEVGVTPLDSSSDKFISIVNNRQSVLPASKVQIIKVNFKVSDITYDSLKFMLARIEKNLHLMDVVDLKYTPIDNKAEITFYTYYLNLTPVNSSL